MSRLILLTVFLVLGGKACFAGGMDSGGVDNKPYGFGAAWFLGDEPVRFCYQRASNFGVSDRDVLVGIQKAVDSWKYYARRKRLYNEEIQSSSPWKMPSFNWVHQNICDGTEDVAIYLGVENSAVTAAKSSYLNPTALAHRTSYDMINRKGKGFIWFAPPNSISIKDYPKDYPNWSVSNAFYGIMLHELGHVFGVDHVRGTIMSDELVWLFNPTVKEMPEIDRTRELVVCNGCDAKFEGQLSDKPEAVFKFLAGYDPKGKVKAQFYLSPQDKNGQKFVLAVSDNTNSLAFNLSVYAPSIVQGPQNIFQVIRRTPNTKEAVEWTGIGARSEVYYGCLTLKNGNVLPIVVERNIDGMFPTMGLLQVFALNQGSTSDGGRKLIFTATHIVD